VAARGKCAAAGEAADRRVPGLGLTVDAGIPGCCLRTATARDALKHRVEGLYLASEALQDANRLRINILALGARLPTMWAQQELAEAGGLMSYGPNFPDLWRRAGDFVDKILRGAKPADIPVEQPTKFDLVINLANCSEGAGPRNPADAPGPRRRGDHRRNAIVDLGS
jgi:hypothetical protein